MSLITSLITVTLTDHVMRGCHGMGASRTPREANTGKTTKMGVSGALRSTGTPNERMRRRATLPHPLECSTIAVPGLSFRVRKGTGRLTWAMTTAKPIRTANRKTGGRQNRNQPHDRFRSWRSGNRTTDASDKRLTSIVVTTRNSVPCHPTRKPPQDETQSPTKKGDRKECAAFAR